MIAGQTLRVRIIPIMDTNQPVAELDAEIARLEEVKRLLTGAGGGADIAARKSGRKPGHRMSAEARTGSFGTKLPLTAWIRPDRHIHSGVISSRNSDRIDRRLGLK
jgi:hypothetical protein